MTHTAYVVGFAMDDLGQVVLIRKKRPEWQAGLLNGVGGHIETVCRRHDHINSSHNSGCAENFPETPVAAMVREFREETGVGLSANRWGDHIARIEHEDASIFVFRAKITDTEISMIRNVTDEDVEVHLLANVVRNTLWGGGRTAFTGIGNLAWLLSLAAYSGDTYQPILVLANSAEVAGR